MSRSSRLKKNALWQLLLFRMRTLVREPDVLIWGFVLPLFLSLILGFAFRARTAEDFNVAVVSGPDSEALVKRLDAERGLDARIAGLAEARRMLQSGRVALVLVPGETPELLLDPTREQSMGARALTLSALERWRNAQPALQVIESPQDQPGARYIDFLIPGLLGLGLFSASLGVIGYPIVQLRVGRLMKTFSATPMRRGHFLLGFLLSRSALVFFEVAVFLTFGYFVFGIEVVGRLIEVFAFAFLAAICFGGIGLLVACRARNNETSSAMGNLFMFPMMMFSGVFFPASHFPDWSQGLIQLLPLTAVTTGLRALINDGVPLVSLFQELAVVGGWAVAAFAVALKLFRWE